MNNQLIRVNKAGATFLLHCSTPLDRAYIMQTVDDIDIHYDLKSDRGEKELASHGIVRLKETEVIVINL